MLNAPTPLFRAPLLLLLALTAACGTDESGSASVTGQTDAGDASGAADTDPTDTGAADTDPTDTGAADTDPTDTSTADTDPTDTSAADTDPTDTSPADTDPTDTSTADTDPTDTDLVDTDPADTADTDPADTADTDPADTTDTSADTGTELPGDGGLPWLVDPEAIPSATDLFPLSVQSGAMRSQSVLLWTFVTTSETVRLRVWRDDALTGERLLVRDELVTPNGDGYLHAPVDGLLPGTWYQYAFFSEAGDGLLARSPVGRVKTAPAPGDLSPVVVTATSCTSASQRPYSALGAMANRTDAELFLHLGDQSYNDGITDLGGFRDAWRSTLTEPGYLALHQAMGTFQTWDDHEVDNDYNPTTIAPSILANAFQSYFETFPVERGPSGGIWTNYEWGDTVEFIILDSRSERYQPDNSYYISQAQMDFVKDRLTNSTAHFKVLLNSVPITDMPTGYFGESDRWEGYDRQRDELLNHITDNDIRNVWFLSGDFHIGMVTRVNNSGPARRIHEIAVGPGDNRNPAASLLDTLENFGGTDQLIWHTTSLQSSVQTLLTFDPARNQVRIEFRGADGTTYYDEWLSEGS
jgi:phosphodiesterase/alkaline phosphatase D-like protein